MELQRIGPFDLSKNMHRVRFYQVGCALSMVLYTVAILGGFWAEWLTWVGIGFALMGISFASGWVMSLDEAARQAHYTSWYWGGSAGLMASVLILFALAPQLMSSDGWEALRSPAPIFADTSYAFVMGLGLGVGPALIGYLLWLAMAAVTRG